MDVIIFMGDFNIVLYGDSNTYGYNPFGDRFNNRYGNVLKRKLGNNYNVYEESVVGRTTIYDDIRSGRKSIENVELELSKYNKINLLIIMLGTNDFKIKNARLSSELEKGVQTLINKIKEFNNISKILLISPVLLDENIEKLDSDFDHNSYILSKCASVIYESIAKNNDLLFFDAKTVAFVGEDGEHLTEESHIALGNALAHFVVHNINT